MNSVSLDEEESKKVINPYYALLLSQQTMESFYKEREDYYTSLIEKKEGLLGDLVVKKASCGFDEEMAEQESSSWQNYGRFLSLFSAATALTSWNSFTSPISLLSTAANFYFKSSSVAVITALLGVATLTTVAPQLSTGVKIISIAKDLGLTFTNYKQGMAEKKSFEKKAEEAFITSQIDLFNLERREDLKTLNFVAEENERNLENLATLLKIEESFDVN